ncbi:hypothetical protein L7F22_038413 [Adiantum nelumboides]|nr:hypothetical protein [Adiantum nelumboides]
MEAASMTKALEFKVCFLLKRKALLGTVTAVIILCLARVVMQLLKGSIPKIDRLGRAIAEFERMYRLGSMLSQESILNLLQRCIREKDIKGGKCMHQLLIALRLDVVAILVEHLIRLFTLSHYLFEANMVFSKVVEPNVFTWHAVILANVEQGNNGGALGLYKELQQDGCEPNKFIYMGVLRACSNIGALDTGRFLNENIIKSRLDQDVILGNTLIDMYAKCGSLIDACKVFDDLPCRDILSWGALLGGYVDNGKGACTIKLFQGMLLEGIKPNKVILLCVLKACGGSRALLQGRLLHDDVMRLDLLYDPAISSALIDMYAKCGCLYDACNVLETSTGRCVVSWGALIGGLTQQGQHIAAFDMFERMKRGGTKPNEFIFSSLASACSKSKDLQLGKFLHDQIIQNGVEADTILGNTLVSMYADCECLLMAQNIFDKLSNRSIVSWSTMISGYTHNGNALDALKLFQRMQQEGSKANMVIYSSILKACSSIGTLELGKLVHHFLLKCEANLDVVVGTSLIELYASCHLLEEACNVFDRLSNRNVVCWGVMIASIAQSGMFSLVRQYLDKMLQHGFKLNEKILTCILVACNQKGKFEEGQYYKFMTEVHGIVPSVEHIHCMVDLLGRSGFLTKAEKLLQSMHTTNDLSGWISLLSACRSHNVVCIGKRCFNHIIAQDYHVGAVYALMSCIYAEAHMWDDYYQLLEQMKMKVPKEQWVQDNFIGSQK